MASSDPLQSELAAGINTAQSLRQNVLPVVGTVASSVGAKTAILKDGKGLGSAVITTETILQEPRKSYNFQVSMDFGTGTNELITNVKTIDRPKIEVQYLDQRYFNTTKRIIKGIIFAPLRVSIYDTLDNTVYEELTYLLGKLFPQSTNAAFNVGTQLYEIASVDNLTMKSFSIHSGSAPIKSLLGSASALLNDGLQRALSNGVVKTMDLTGVTLDKVDFGEYDYSSSEPQVINLELSYQALLFRESKVSDSLATALGGLGLQSLIG